MTIAYEILFRVTVQHSFYKDGVSADFSFEPTPATRRLLDTYGLVFKKFKQGFTVFARVEPGTNPPKLFIPIHQGSLRFGFLMLPNNRYFYNYTKFHNNRFPQAGKELLYFSNAKMPAADAPVLGDKVSAGPGTYLQWLNRDVLNLKYAGALSSAHPALSDMFGKTYTPVPGIDLPAGQATDELQIDFKKVNEIKPGRYRVSDASLPNDVQLYYEPESGGREVFGIVDIFSDTKDFTNPATDQVDAKYKFLNGDALNRGPNKELVADYRVALEASQYELRYIVRIKPETLATVDSSKLAITGSPAFTKVPNGSAEATFTSNAVIPWSETAPVFTLMSNSTKLKSLPQPTFLHPLKTRSNPVILFYDLNIYV